MRIPHVLFFDTTLNLAVVSVFVNKISNGNSSDEEADFILIEVVLPIGHGIGCC
jgi:hypothetical protein